MPFGMRSSVSRYSGNVSHVQSMPCGHGVGGDVLGPLEVAHDEVALVGPGRRQREAAVAHDHAGDAVPARAGAERVPEHLGVHVGVAVDEAGRDHVAFGVDLVGAPFADAADGGDAAPPDADIGAIARQPRTVDDVTVADHQVVLHGSAPRHVEEDPTVACPPVGSWLRSPRERGTAMAGNGMRGWAAVTGVAERKPTRWTDGETTIDMTARIGVRGHRRRRPASSADIDGLVCHPMGGVPMLVPSTIGEAMGLRVTYAATVDLGGATGAGMVWRAAAAIHAGQARAVLCVTAARRQRRERDTAQAQRPVARPRHVGVGRVRGALRQRRRQRRLRHDRQPLPATSTSARPSSWPRSPCTSATTPATTPTPSSTASRSRSTTCSARRSWPTRCTCWRS